MTVQHVSRREFLTSAGGTLAGAAVTAGCAPLMAIEPFARNGKPILKLSLAAYSLRQFFRADPGSEQALDMPAFIDYCASLGLDGAELTSYFFPESFDRAYLHELKRRAHIAGLDISGGAIRNNFTLPPGERLDEDLAHTRTWIDHYAALGAPVIRIFAGSPPEGTTAEEAIRRCVPVIERVCEYAASRGVMLALENHDFTRDARRMLQIVEAVQSPWFGVNFDSGNFHSDDPYADMERIAPYTINAQIKTEIRTAGGRSGPADLSRIVGILRDADYSGYIVLEYEAEENPYEAIPRHVEALRELISA
jgi:sugar phosphate isomerase/epimerase